MRVISLAVNQAMNSERMRLAILVEVTLPDPIGVMRFTNTAHTIPWGGVEWQGAGTLLSLEVPQEDSSLEAHRGILRLNGLDPAMLSIGLWSGLNFAPVSVWTAFFDPDTNLPLEGVLFFRGTVGQVKGIPVTEAEG